jgi:hypothetical protein
MAARNVGMRLGAALVLLGALTACLAASGIGRATTVHSGCNALGSKTILRSGGVRVYRLRGKAYGCVESSGATKRLSPESGPTGQEFILSRPFAANAPWVVGAFTHPGPKGEIDVAVRARNLNLGDVTPTCRIASGGGRRTPEIDKTVVENSGIFAWSGYEPVWILVGPHNEQEEVFRSNVYACVHGGRGPDPVKLDSSFSEVVKVNSLVLHGHTLEWERTNGERCRAILRRPSRDLPPISESVTGCSKPNPF